MLEEKHTKKQKGLRKEPPWAMYNPQGCQAASQADGKKEGKEALERGKLASDTLLLFLYLRIKIWLIIS